MNSFAIDLTRPIVLPSGTELVYSLSRDLWHSEANDMISYSSGRLYQMFGVNIPYKEVPWYGDALNNGWALSSDGSMITKRSGQTMFGLYPTGTAFTVVPNVATYYIGLGKWKTPAKAVEAIEVLINSMEVN